MSNVIGYSLTLGITTLLLTSSVLITNSLLDNKTRQIAELQAQNIADQVADSVLEALIAYSMESTEYEKTIDVLTDLSGFIFSRSYYVEFTDENVYVNTTDGSISRQSTLYNTEVLGVGLSGRAYVSSGQIKISYDKPDIVYKLDFGTGNSINHSAVQAGYHMVSRNTTIHPFARSPFWHDSRYRYRIPIKIENKVPPGFEDTYTSKNLTNFPIKMILRPSNFDYSKANVNILSSSEALSDLVFYDGDPVKIFPQRYDDMHILYVYNGFDGPGPIDPWYNPSNHFKKIQDAIDDPNSDNSIIYIIDSEVCYEFFTIPAGKSLSIIGQSKEGVVIDGKENGDVISINSDDILISTLTINNSKSGDAGISISNRKNISIINCNISKNDYGIYIVRSSEVNIFGCDCKFNSVKGMVFYQDNSKSSIINCNVLNNTWGIRLRKSNNITIKYCNISNNGGTWGDGLEIEDDSENNTIIGNIIGNNGDYGIEIINSRFNLISGNLIINNDDGFDGRGIYIDDSFSQNNTIHHNALIDNHKNAEDNGRNNIWDNNYPSGGNYWSDCIGSDGDGDGICNTPYEIYPLGVGPDVFDRYPLNDSITIKPGLPYCIDHWNPRGESVIHVSTDIKKNSTKYLYLYYGFDGDLNNTHRRNLSDVSLFFEDFKTLSDIKWNLSSPTIQNNITRDPVNKNNSILYLNSDKSKEFIIANYTIPIPANFSKSGLYESSSRYIVDAKIKINRGNGNIIILSQNPRNFDWSYLVSINHSKSLQENRFRIFKNHTTFFDPYEFDSDSLPSLNRWLRLRSYIHINHTINVIIPPAPFDIFWWKNVSIDNYLYDYSKYAYFGNVQMTDSSHEIENWNIDHLGPPLQLISLLMSNPVSANGSIIGLGAGLLPGSTNANISVDWIRLLKDTTGFSPTVQIGASESINYGWIFDLDEGLYFVSNEYTNSTYSYDPGLVLYDFINPIIPTGLYNTGFGIKDLAPGTYTITLTIGNISGSTEPSTIKVHLFSDNNIITPEENTISLPSTEEGWFETVSFTVTVPSNRNGFLLKFINPFDDWQAISSMIIERGVKGVSITGG